MAEILDNIARNCGRGRGGIFSIVAIPCDGITWSVIEDLATIGVQTKVAKTISLDFNSGKASSTQEGDRANFNSIYKESVEFTVKNSELATSRTIASLNSGLHTYIVRYADGKNKIYGADGIKDALGNIKSNGMFGNGVADSGTEGGDLNGWVVTATSESGGITPEISNTDVDTIVAFTV